MGPIGGWKRCYSDSESYKYQVDVEAELQHAVDIGQVVEHDLGVDAGEEPAQNSGRQEHERRVQPDDTETKQHCITSLAQSVPVVGLGLTVYAVYAKEVLIS